ncbi:hypothetical protein L6261_00930 [Candidatus Parcubacteria bacterium]|nr:hypothetical protein [Candidatus Parcubacteria bacterium]
MSNLIGILGVGWFVVLVFFCYCLLVGIVAEFALGHPKINEYGELRVRENSFVINNLYKENFLSSYPENFCQLLRGLGLGMIFFVCKLVGFIIVIIITLIFILVTLPFPFLFGYLPWFSSEATNKFKPYQTYGKNNEKKFIAPWKILLPITLVYFAVSWRNEILGVITRTGNTAVAVGTPSSFWLIIAGLSLLISFVAYMVYLFHSSKTTENWAVIKAWAKAKQSKICPGVELVDE